MNKWNPILIALLAVSLCLNLYLLLPLPSPPNAVPSLSASKPSAQGTERTIESVDTSDTSYSRPESSQFYIPVDLEQDREILLRQAQTWLTEKDFRSLIPFLHDYLKLNPQDMDFLLIEAKMLVETQLLSDAIVNYYDLLRNPMTVAQQDEIEQQIIQLSQNTIDQLKRNYSWEILAVFVEPLLQLEPNNRLYILSLATAYAEQLQDALMEDVLAALEFDDPDAEKIRQIVATPDDYGQDSEAPASASVGRSIPLKQFGDQYVVSGVLSGNTVELLIDTGASITAISQQYFDSLSNRYKVNHLGRFSVNTAGVSVRASMYQFRELTLQHVTVENLPVVVLPIEGMENADGLLGMNFLKEFDFKIDQQQAVMFIK